MALKAVSPAERCDLVGVKLEKVHKRLQKVYELLHVCRIFHVCRILSHHKRLCN